MSLLSAVVEEILSSFALALPSLLSLSEYSGFESAAKPDGLSILTSDEFLLYRYVRHDERR